MKYFLSAAALGVMTVTILSGITLAADSAYTFNVTNNAGEDRYVDIFKYNALTRTYYTSASVNKILVSASSSKTLTPNCGTSQIKCKFVSYQKEQYCKTEFVWCLEYADRYNEKGSISDVYGSGSSTTVTLNTDSISVN